MAIIVIANLPAAARVISLAKGLFIISYIILSVYAVYLADRYSKLKIMVSSKVLEIVITAADRAKQRSRRITAIKLGGILAAGILVLAPISSKASPRPMPQLCDPLYWAIQYHDVEKTTELLRQGVTRFSIKLSGDKQTPLHLAARNGDVHIVRLLLDSKAYQNENERLLGNDTPLHSAAQSWNPAVVPLLVQAGADVNARANHGITPLLKAVFSANRELICALIDNGADLNAQHSSGKTSLHAAVDMGKRDLFMLLLSKGADINIRDLKGRTALDTLRARKGPMVGGKELQRYVAKRMAWIAAVEAFLRDPDSVPTPSCSYTEEEFKRILKDSYSYIGIQTQLEQGADWVPFNGDLETLKLLLRYRRFRSPSDALLAVVKSGNWPDPDSVAYLLERGADINVQDERGRTPLHYAVHTPHRRLVRLLIMCEANPRIRDKDGNTPIDLAKKKDRGLAKALAGGSAESLSPQNKAMVKNKILSRFKGLGKNTGRAGEILVALKVLLGAFEAFFEEYGRLPGDFELATGYGLGSANGNWNGRIDSVEEEVSAWQHLARAGPLEKDFNGRFRGRLAPGKNIPLIASGVAVRLLETDQFDGTRKLYLALVDPKHPDRFDNPVLTPIEASLIEKRLDRNTSRAHDGHAISTNSSSRHQCHRGPPYYEFQHHAEKACGTYVEVPSQYHPCR